jgi:serine/threonine protein phosphatase PrpC
VLVCSDGIWDVLEDAEAADILMTTRGSPEEEVTAVLREAAARGSSDNRACAVLQLDSDDDD